MDHLIFYIINQEAIQKLDLNIHLDPLRRKNITLVSDPKNLYLKAKDYQNVLLFYINEHLDKADKIRLNILSGKLHNLRICLVAHEQHALTAWRMQLFDFKTIPFVLRDIKDTYYRYKKSGQPREEYFLVKTRMGKEKLPLRSVNFLRSDGNFTDIHMNTGKAYKITKKLKEYEAMISPYPFLTRFNRFFIINTANIASISDNELIFYSRQTIKLSRELRQKIEKSIFKP